MSEVLDKLLFWVPLLVMGAVAALAVIAPATKTQKDDKILSVLQRLLALLGKAAVHTLLPTKSAQGFAAKVLADVHRATEQKSDK